MVDEENCDQAMKETDDLKNDQDTNLDDNSYGTQDTSTGPSQEHTQNEGEAVVNEIHQTGEDLG